MTDDSLQGVIEDLDGAISLGRTIATDELKNIRQRLAALSAQTEARDDTARIDYLETLRGDMIAGSSDDQELIGHDWVIYGQFYTVREALDYGMMKRQERIAQGDL